MVETRHSSRHDPSSELALLLWSLLFTLFLCPPALGQEDLAADLHWVSSGMNNRDITFSPDGKVLLTTITSPKNHFSAIAISVKRAGTWSSLEIAPFSGHYQDIEAIFSPDGKQVFFASTRPKPDREGSDWDIWRLNYEKGNWSEPVNLGEPVNSSGAEFYPSVAANGNLYFTATREQGLGSEDIYRAVYEKGRYNRIENLGPGVNSQAFEFNAFVAPDESYLIFGSQGREGEVGGGDLYISRAHEGRFEDARLLNREINTSRLDYCPSVFQGRLYFTSERMTSSPDLSDFEALQHTMNGPGNGLGDIYSIPFDAVE